MAASSASIFRDRVGQHSPNAFEALLVRLGDELRQAFAATRRWGVGGALLGRRDGAMHRVDEPLEALALLLGLLAELTDPDPPLFHLRVRLKHEYAEIQRVPKELEEVGLQLRRGRIAVEVVHAKGPKVASYAIGIADSTRLSYPAIRMDRRQRWRRWLQRSRNGRRPRCGRDCWPTTSAPARSPRPWQAARRGPSRCARGWRRSPTARRSCWCTTPLGRWSRRISSTACCAGWPAGRDGVVPALPLTDTVKRVDGERVLETLDRTALVAVQTPQGFPAALLRGRSSGRATTSARRPTARRWSSAPAAGRPRRGRPAQPQGDRRGTTCARAERLLADRPAD